MGQLSNSSINGAHAPHGAERTKDNVNKSVNKRIKRKQARF